MNSAPKFGGSYRFRSCSSPWFSFGCSLAFGWGHEGHAVVGLIAEHYMTAAALKEAGNLLDGAMIDSVASWADDYAAITPKRDLGITSTFPFADSKIDLVCECPNGDCVVVKTEQFLAVVKDHKADRAAKAEAL